MMLRRGLALPVTCALALSLGAAAMAYAAADDRLQLERLNVRETVLNAEQGRNLNRMARLLTALAQFRRDPPPALLVSPQDATQAVRAAILVKAVTPELQRRAKIYASEAVEIARQRRLAAVASEALFTNDSQLAEHRERLEATPPGAAPLEFGPITPPATLLLPAKGPITHGFGETLTGGGESTGIIIAAPKGAEVAAPEAGLVQYVGPVKGWGVILILRLPGGYHLVLAGLDRATVGIGQSVAAGSPVGWMTDGRQSPSELYLEVRERGVPVDPAKWLGNKTE
ncbi:MAG: peptidoglycan DD-metalloendopeptidase family protein [Phenylobacterium sp.]|uniref:murein hydrolase activator EnvC family protein n=1 Tax=Phenylobacterium sp. TaxID=1871053 RepID=UPI00271FE33C|nr:peptidoglycan DD-metalloendopeptidase family protein [Phenylobacterium sp.]MDO9432694.1 peptidoglycan DD-metalloendopeptidase family protein [Phenylobacterium sp.]